MRMSFLGDSYDIVKRSLLLWLKPLGEWSVHPMFTKNVSDEEFPAYELLMGARVITREKLVRNTDREEYFSCVQKVNHLFLDPDTGLRLEETTGKKAQNYLFASDLLRLARQRRESLTMIFDQSFRRIKSKPKKEQLNDKLQYLLKERIYGFAYDSHACFLMVSCDMSLAKRARNQLIAESRLPESRFQIDNFKS